MDLHQLWFILISVLFIGYFFLEGFDYGVGILLPFLGQTDRERRVIINTIGPFWDANEVWLLTAGGAIFAAFPNWYATMFSGFYLALFLMLLALIVRGVAFEFRSKDKNPRWRALWDWMICVGSFVPALLWGVAIANLVRGLKIDADMTYVGAFWDLLNPYALVGGLASLAAFTLHGAVFIGLRTRGEMEQKATTWAARLWAPAVATGVVFAIAGYFATDMFSKEIGVNPGPVPIGATAALLASGWFIRSKRNGWAFVMTGLAIVLATITVFMGLYPRVMISSLNADWSLTIYTAASSDYTLKVMTVVALIFVPITLIYQGWSYWIFRERINGKQKLEY
jgi:cytochrome d ubiquinol oxidase subunit II